MPPGETGPIDALIWTDHPDPNNDARASLPIQVPNHGSVFFIPGRPSVYQIEAAGYWSSPQSTEGESPPPLIVFQLWRTAEVTGRLHVDGREVPTQLDLHFHPITASTTADPQGQADPQGEVGCTVDVGGHFQCIAPAAQLDLELHAPGYQVYPVPQQRLTPQATLDLGHLKLSPSPPS